jgi:ribose transport system substrate-binding protein
VSLTRRCLLSALASVVLDEGLAAKRAGGPESKITLVTQVASLRNFYDAWWSKGASTCAAALRLPHILLQSEGDFSGRGHKQIDETIFKTKGNMVLNLDAPSSLDELRQLIDLCIKHKVYFVTNNNLPPTEFRPWNTNPYYVAHIEFDHRLAGSKTARELIGVMGGKGGIIAFQGEAGDSAASQRFRGLQDALSAAPHCYMLAAPANAEWAASAAYDIMRGLIAEHGFDRIAGVWAANDDMALGTIEAVQLYRRSIPVTGFDGSHDALSAIQSGVMTATVAWDSFWQGGIGLSLAASAKTGLFDPAQQPHEHRAFYGPFWVVTGNNVGTFLEYRNAERPIISWQDFGGNPLAQFQAAEKCALAAIMGQETSCHTSNNSKVAESTLSCWLWFVFAFSPFIIQPAEHRRRPLH